MSGKKPKWPFQDKKLTKTQHNRRMQKGKALGTALKGGDKDWNTPCQNCDELPTVHPTELCGPCCFGEADTFGGNW